MTLPPPVAADAARSMIAVDRALSELRRGRPVVVLDEAGSTDADGLALMATETATDPALVDLARAGPLFLALTPNRANVLHVQSAATDPVLIPLTPRLDAAALQALADPTADLDRPLQGPFTARIEAPPRAAAAAILLCKKARLLPSAILLPLKRAEALALAETRDLLTLGRAEAEAYEAAAASTLRLLTRARVPLAEAEAAQIFAFRPADGGIEHLAILIGDPPRSGPVLTRLHSECFTGDLLGSLRCDCGEQLRGAIAQMREAGAGLLLYLAQEGRGIGLINKLRAYRLQDQGFDTVDANIRLGFDADERLFHPAAEMLRQLGFESVRLLTNNPEKVEGLARCGIRVTERVPHAFPANSHNEAYLATKKRRSGHYL